MCFAIVPFVNFAPTSRMAIPAFLAIVTWLIFNVVGLIKQGPIRYFKDTLFPPGVPWPIYILLAPIELFSVFIVRPLTLAVRLLANMMAGHVLLTIFFLFTHDLLIENLGPTFIKLGQLLSTRSDLLPPAYLEALARLQDKVEPCPYEDVELKG